MASQLCTSCGRKAGRGTFCTHCGGKLVSAAPVEPRKVLDVAAIDEIESGSAEENDHDTEPETTTAENGEERSADSDDAGDAGSLSSAGEDVEDFFGDGAAKTVRLEAIAGPCAGIAVTVVDGEIAMIGANPAANLCLTEDKCVSRRHAAVSFTGGRVYVKDFGSSNGSYVKLQGEVELADGDVLLAGKTLIRITVGN
jgi:hypothetical protein